MSDEQLIALIRREVTELRREVVEAVRDALRSAQHDQSVPSAARREGECPDDETSEQGSSDRRTAKTRKRGERRFSNRSEMAKDVDDLIDTLAERAARRTRKTG